MDTVAEAIKVAKDVDVLPMLVQQAESWLRDAQMLREAARQSKLAAATAADAEIGGEERQGRSPQRKQATKEKEMAKMERKLQKKMKR